MFKKLGVSSGLQGYQLDTGGGDSPSVTLACIGEVVETGLGGLGSRVATLDW